METNCPSCGAMHRTEDYPGAFDILCACGYLILNPEIVSSSSHHNEINFEGPPAVDQTSAGNRIQIHSTEEALPQIDIDLDFSAENLTPPEKLPEGMLYDPGEIPIENESFASPPREENKQVAESTFSRIFVERVQKASIGQILGPDYDLELLDLGAHRMKARERVEKFLDDHKWLKEEMERRSFMMKDLFQNEKLEKIPEALAVEIYIACLENGGKCLFIRSEE